MKKNVSKTIPPDKDVDFDFLEKIQESVEENEKEKKKEAPSISQQNEDAQKNNVQADYNKKALSESENGVKSSIEHTEEDTVLKNDTVSENDTVTFNTGPENPVSKNDTVSIINTYSSIRRPAVLNYTVLKYDTVLKSNQGKWRYVSTFNTMPEITNHLLDDQKLPQDIEKQILYLSLIEDITNFLLKYSYSVPFKGNTEDNIKKMHLTGNNFLLLTYFIKETPVCNHSIRALASLLGLTPRTITTTLQDLEGLDMINRIYDKNSNYREGQTITIKPFLEKYILDRNITNLNSEDILTFLSTYSVEEIDTVSKINTVLDINTSTPVLYCFSFKNNKQYNTKNNNYENEKTMKNPNKFSLSSTKINELKEVFLACCFFGFENVELKLTYPTFNKFLKQLSEDENSFSQIVLYRQLYYAKQKIDSMSKVTTQWGYYFGVIENAQDKKSTDENGKEIQEMIKFLISVAKELPFKINDVENQMIQNQILQTAYKTKGNVDPVKIIQKYLFPNLPTNIMEISQALSELFKKAYSEYFEVVKKLEDKIQRKKWDIRNKN